MGSKRCSEEVGKSLADLDPDAVLTPETRDTYGRIGLILEALK